MKFSLDNPDEYLSWIARRLVEREIGSQIQKIPATKEEALRALVSKHKRLIEAARMLGMDTKGIERLYKAERLAIEKKYDGNISL